MAESPLIQLMSTPDGVSDFERGTSGNRFFSPRRNEVLVAQATASSVQTGILSLGTRGDAITWKEGCESVGLSAATVITNPRPTLDELESFFKSSPDWIYFGGHFGGGILSNEDGTIDLEFDKDRVTLTLNPTPASHNTTVLQKHSANFGLHKKCKVMLWGGCSVCSSESNIRNLRKLFNNPLILGFAGLTGWRIVDAVLGGGFIHNHFFSRIKERTHDLSHVRDAWLKTALYGWGGTKLETRFRAIAPNGQEWRLANKAIVKGRTF